MIKKTLIFILLIGLQGNFADRGAVASAEQEFVVEYYNIHYSGKLKTGSKFELLLTTKAYSKKIKKPKSLPKEGYWGTDGRDPFRVIEKLQLTLGEENISIPRKAFSDLGDVVLPGSAYLMETPDGVNLYLKGGDGVAGYKVIFHIKKGMLASRTIEFMNMKGEFDSIETEYSK